MRRIRRTLSARDSSSYFDNAYFNDSSFYREEGYAVYSQAEAEVDGEVRGGGGGRKRLNKN